MRIKTVIPWGVVFATYLIMIYVLGPIDYNFAGLAHSGITFVVVVLGAYQLADYFYTKSKKKVHAA